MIKRLALCVFWLLASSASAQRDTAPAKAPFPYVWGKAFHILPETHTDESGYFSIIEGNDGKIYVGTAKYDYNAYLVEFDPRTETQKIVIDTNQLNGLSATGFAAQSKIHTRNFVGPSGKVYCGSQEGYRRIEGDKSTYPGGYVMVYDPQTQRAESLGMPMEHEGIIDVVADESRGVVYVVTTWGEDQKAHWLIGDIATKKYRDLGVLPTNYASTLMDAKGRAHVITAESRLATYDPESKQVAERAILLNGTPWKREDANAIPTWQLAPAKSSAYLILMNDPSLVSVGFDGEQSVNATVLGKMLDGASSYDSRSSLTVAPDGRVYAIVKVPNETGYGSGNLHHLTRYDPVSKKTEDVGVLAVKNPDFFDFGPRADGSPPPWSHGYHKLPDGTMTPLHGHQGLIATKSGDLYALILYPYTLLKIEGVSVPAKSHVTQKTSPSRQYTDWALRAVDDVEKNLPEITRVAEIMADRHVSGGAIGFAWNGQSLQQELSGRAGGLMHLGFNRPWKDRDPAGDKFNMAIIGWDRDPGGGAVEALRQLKQSGTYIIGFGPRDMPELAECVKICDAFFDTGMAADDRVVTLSSGKRAGRGNAVVNMLNGWALTGEFIAALTRRGKMPPIWKSWTLSDGKEWSDRYFGQSQFHNEFNVAPIKAGALPRAFFREVRSNIKRFRDSQNNNVIQAAELLTREKKAGRQCIVAAAGHAPWTIVGHYEDAGWGTLFQLETVAPNHVEMYKSTPEGALVLRLGCGGLDQVAADIFAAKKQRVILISVPDERPDFQHTQNALLNIDMLWKQGDAVISIPGYPAKLFPISGIMQMVAYESVNTETLERL
jgi:uncharacterized phosphosugar-binding protein